MAQETSSDENHLTQAPIYRGFFLSLKTSGFSRSVRLKAPPFLVPQPEIFSYKVVPN